MKKLSRVAAALTLAATTIVAAPQQQQSPPRYAGQLQIDGLEALAARANEVVDVNVDERLLRLIPLKQLTESADKDEQVAADLLKNLKGIYVRSYEFDAPGGYGDADAAPLRAQLRAPTWTRVVSVVQKREGRTVEVYLANDAANVGGLAVMALEPRRLTVVNIVGSINLEKLSRLEGRFGIPALNIGSNDDPDDDKDDDKPAANSNDNAPAKKP